MVRPKRFELLAYRFVACCSIQLSYERVRSLLKESPLPVKRLQYFFSRSSKKVSGIRNCEPGDARRSGADRRRPADSSEKRVLGRGGGARGGGETLFSRQ